MIVEGKEISQSAYFVSKYETLLQEVKQKFKVKDHKWLEISKPKASRVLSGDQFDILTLIEMAVFVGYDIELTFKEKTNDIF
jgi:hypothetical protein